MMCRYKDKCNERTVTCEERFCLIAQQEINKELQKENAELKSRIEKSVKLPCKVGEECYILKLPFMKIEKATALFTCLATRTESGTQIMNMRNVFKTKEEAEQALKGGAEKCKLFLT